MKKYLSKLYTLIQNKIFLLIVVLFTFVSLFAESYKYSGFVRNHFYIDPLILVGISVLTAILQKEKRSLAFKINRFVLPVTSIIYLIFEFLEAKYYPNYVFSHIHMQPQNFFNLVLFSGILLLVENFNLEKNKTFDKFNLKSFAALLLFITFLITLTESVSKTLNLAINSDFYMLNHLSFNYDDKMKERWGFYYDYMEFIRDNTPENSKILIPPQAYYASVGNAGLDRYFLYPRPLGNGDLYNVITKGYDYVLINPGWPKETIKTDKILILNSDKSISQFKNIYDPNMISNFWGILKLSQ